MKRALVRMPQAGHWGAWAVRGPVPDNTGPIPKLTGCSLILDKPSSRWERGARLGPPWPSLRMPGSSPWRRGSSPGTELPRSPGSPSPCRCGWLRGRREPALLGLWEGSVRVVVLVSSLWTSAPGGL